MRKIDLLLAEYGESHRNHTNKLIHWFCVPAIFFQCGGTPLQYPFRTFARAAFVFGQLLQLGNHYLAGSIDLLHFTLSSAESWHVVFFLPCASLWLIFSILLFPENSGSSVLASSLLHGFSSFSVIR